MDMLQKLKQRLAEEISNDSDGDEEGDESRRGGDARRTENLEREVANLKEVINKNYEIYVKRLEKRKARIQEQDEYAKYLLKENEELVERLKGLEDCQRQLTESRENLEQLENWKIQELSKVKHMLLSAENALESERKEKHMLQRLLEDKGPGRRDPPDGEDSQESLAALKDKIKDLTANYTKSIEALKSNHEAALKEMKSHHEAEITSKAEVTTLETQSIESKSDSSELSALKKDLVSMKSELSTVMNERDSLKNALIMMEIAQHERQASLLLERDESRIELSKIITEKETLQMVVDLKEKELKARKEELRKNTETLEEKQGESHRIARDKDSRIFSLEEEVKVLKARLADDFDHIESLRAKIDDLEHDYKDIQLREEAHEQALASNREDLVKFEAEVVALKEALRSERDESSSLRSAHEAALTEVADVREERDRVTDKLRSLDQSRANLLQEIDNLRSEIKEGEDTFPTRVENSLLVQDLRRKLREAEDELIEKKKAIKLHQQRMTDLKKTFQKEMKSSVSNTDLHAFPASHLDGRAQANGGAENHEEGALQSGKASPLFASGQSGLVETSGPAVNFKYLKHVIFKFLTSREYEAKQLTKAVSALLYFTPDEEKLLEEHLNWKCSWFGSRPKLGSGQFSLSIDH